MSLLVNKYHACMVSFGKSSQATQDNREATPNEKNIALHSLIV